MKDRLGLLGKKIGMTQVFNADGTRSGVTAIEVGPCFVVHKRTPEKDGYSALQIGFDELPERKARRPVAGHFAKAGVAPQRHLREFRVPAEKAAEYEVGQEIKLADLFGMGDKVDVIGTSKGKGFTGVMKKFDFAGAKATHGVHEAFRHGGSLGQCMTPGRVMKGKKMAGQQIGLTLYAFKSETSIRLGFNEYNSKLTGLKKVLSHLRTRDSSIDFRAIDLVNPSRIVVFPKKAEATADHQKEA